MPGRGQRSSSPITALSKNMARLLRHNPMHIQLDVRGFARLPQALGGGHSIGRSVKAYRRSSRILLVGGFHQGQGGRSGFGIGGWDVETKNELPTREKLITNNCIHLCFNNCAARQIDPKFSVLPARFLHIYVSLIAPTRCRSSSTCGASRACPKLSSSGRRAQHWKIGKSLPMIITNIVGRRFSSGAGRALRFS